MRRLQLILTIATLVACADAHATIEGNATCWTSAAEHLGAQGYQLNADCLTIVPDQIEPGPMQGHLQPGINRDEKYVGGPASEARASYSVRGDYGNLGISVRADNAATYHERNGGREAGDASSYASAQVSFEDGLRVRSNSLADGQAITIELYGRIDAEVYGHSSAPLGSSIDRAFYAYAALTGSGAPDDTFVLCMGDSVGGSDCDSESAGAYTLTVNTFVGAQLRLQGSMSAVAWTSSFADEANAAVSTVAWIEAMGSLHTQLRSTSDVFFVSDSGTDYVAAVPEPATNALLGLGAGCLALLARRRTTRPGVR